MEYVLGIDTSCYTTSVALMSMSGELLADERIILSVPKGGRGLRQSEMVFAHTKNLPLLFEKAYAHIQNKNTSLKAIGVSAFPRRMADSYMPAFLAGESFARSLSAAMDVPIFRLSHQENHISAGIWSVGGWEKNNFLAAHVSGGTTEVARARLDDSSGQMNFELEIIGGSMDIHAGQFIDRLGVRLGLAFPCGAALEKLAALNIEPPLKIPVSVHGAKVSFAGPETFAAKAFGDGQVSPPALAAGAQIAVAESLNRLLKSAVEVTGLSDILLVGGVLSNTFIRRYLTENLKACLYFPAASYSPDNAVGAAYAAVRSLR